MDKSSKQAAPQLGPYQEGVKKALKSMGEQHATEAIQQGVPPQHIEQQAGLNPNEVLTQLLSSISQQNAQIPTSQQLMQQGQQMVNVPGTMQGPFTALKGLVRGKGYNPMAPYQVPIGFSGAQKMAEWDMARQKQMLDTPKTAADLVKSLIDIQQSDPNFKLEQLGKEERLKADIRAQEEQSKAIQKDQLESEKNFNQVLGLNDNLISSLKGAFEQQGGSGPIAGMLGNAKAAFGMANTGNIKALKAVKRDTAISYARQLAGSSKGVSLFFQKVLDSLPDNKFTSEQAGTTLAELSLTAFALKKGIDDLKLSKDQLDKMDPSQLETLASKERSSMSQEEQDKIYSAMQDRFSKIAPRKSINLEGKIGNQQSKSLPMQNQAPKGAKGWDTDKKEWVY